MKVLKVLVPVLAIGLLVVPAFGQNLAPVDQVASPPLQWDAKSPTGHAPPVLANVFGDTCGDGADLGILGNGATADYDTTGMACDDFTAGCPATPCFGLAGCLFGAPDAVAKFQVDTTGSWNISACGGTHDNELMVMEGSCGGTCIGGNDDSCNACASPWNASADVFLIAGTDYWLAVGGYTSAGADTVVFTLVQAACVSNLDCDDGVFCNGAETCDVGSGQCLPGTAPCAIYQNCDELGGVCVDPPDCYNWLTHNRGTSFFPWANASGCAPPVVAPGLGAIGDDFALRAGAGRDLISYGFIGFGRNTTGLEPAGTLGTLDTQIWDIDGTGVPLAPIAGTECFGLPIQILPSASPPDFVVCQPNGGLPTGVVLPPGLLDSLAMVYQSSLYGWGFTLPSSATAPVLTPPRIGEVPLGPLGFGTDIFWRANCGTGAWTPSAFAAPTASNFSEAWVCTDPLGACCLGDGTCANTSEDDCIALGGSWQGPDVVGAPALCEDLADGDGDGSPDACDLCPADPGKTEPGICGCGVADTDTDSDGVADCNDNCIDDANAGQENSDGDSHGDACDNCPLADNEDQADADSDTVGDVCDNCPNTANTMQTNSDGDTFGNACDNCPNTTNQDQADSDGDGDGNVCDNCPNTPNPNQANADGDSAGDACDGCPNDPNKLAPGQCGCGVAETGDSDGDGVADCNDVCNGVDDAVFAPECVGQIPTVNEWGMVILAVLLLAAGKVYFGRRTAVN